MIESLAVYTTSSRAQKRPECRDSREIKYSKEHSSKWHGCHVSKSPVLPFCLVDLVCYRSHQDVGCNLPSCRACAPLCTGNDTHATGPGTQYPRTPSPTTPRSVTHHTHIRSQCRTTARHSHTHLRLTSGIWAGGFSKQRCSSAARAPLTARASTRESEAARSRRLRLIALNGESAGQLRAVRI